jgi:Ca2+-binding RTX toxin-like protein
MATWTTLVADPEQLLVGTGLFASTPNTFYSTVPPISLDGVGYEERSSTAVLLRLAPADRIFSAVKPGIWAELQGSNLTYGEGALPISGTITSIEFGAYQRNYVPPFNVTLEYADLGTTHRLVFDTPINAADLYATAFDLTTLFYGGADSMVGASAGVDRLNGYAGNDTLDGQGGNDTLDGGADNDVLTGGAGDDLLIGGTGHDQLRPAQGVDLVFGGGGDDTILVTDTGGTIWFQENDVLDGSTGTDMLRISTVNSGPVFLQGATISGIETLRIEAGYPVLTPAQFAAFTRVELATGAGSTTTIAITTNGTVNLANLDMPQTPVAQLYVVLDGTPGPGTDFTFTGRDLGTFVNDSVLGSMGDDNMHGAGGNDTLRGNGGNDTLRGGSGNDSLLGQDGNDSIFASTGADTIAGGAGIDTLTGGDAADRFVFTAQDLTTQGQTDRITDFSRTQGDRIDLSGIDANAGVAGDQAFSAPALLNGGAAPPPAGSLRYEVFRDHVLLSLYTDSDVAADFLIRVNGTGWTPAASDFFL